MRAAGVIDGPAFLKLANEQTLRQWGVHSRIKLLKMASALQKLREEDEGGTVLYCSVCVLFCSVCVCWYKNVIRNENDCLKELSFPHFSSSSSQKVFSASVNGTFSILCCVFNLFAPVLVSRMLPK